MNLLHRVANYGGHAVDAGLAVAFTAALAREDAPGAHEVAVTLAHGQRGVTVEIADGAPAAGGSMGPIESSREMPHRAGAGELARISA